MTTRRRLPGFTLLEVLISIAILALGMSTVFGSSVLAARGTSHARMVTNAGLLARCRMEETEAYLRVNQLPDTNLDHLDDPPEMGGLRCCEQPFVCAVRIEKIELPQPADLANSAGDRLLSNAAGAASGTSFAGLADGGASANGAMGALAGVLGAMGSGATDPTQGLASAFGGSSGSSGSGGGGLNLQSMMGQLLSGIYPTLKPLLEGAIRRVTVNVSWNEGSRPFQFDVVEYYTNPAQTMLSGDMMPDAGAGTTGTPPDSGRR